MTKHAKVELKQNNENKKDLFSESIILVSHQEGEYNGSPDGKEKICLKSHNILSW